MPGLILFLPLFLFSCMVGNFSDIGGGNSPLHLYAGTDNQIIHYEVNRETHKTEFRNSFYVSGGSVNRIISDGKNRMLFAACGDTVHSFMIMENGELDPNGMPQQPYPGSLINDIVTADGSKYLYVTVDYTSDLYRYAVSPDSSLSYSPVTPNILPSEPQGMFNIGENGFMFFRGSSLGWTYAYHNDFANLYTYNFSIANLTDTVLAAAIAHKSYLCIIGEIFSTYRAQVDICNYNADEVPLSSRQFLTATPGGARFAAFSDPKGILYFMHNIESQIYCFRVYENGSMESSYRTFSTSGPTDFSSLAVDPYGEYLVFSAGSPVVYLNLMKLDDYGYPDSGISFSQSIPGYVYSLNAFRFEY